ncbi:MAG: HypC/HybG/HupF family hydrogenase formation chaperone [Candidatus Thermoplasmatota archaeon]|nr:HypC/HybG/HupF family hydrogenase formation chaperone [Chloroflexota bacterium]MEA3558489.1 HypC/HybG/HupF family hydrogenase formation chaperone [Candidatus Thermoplasmatota archaeon]
MCLAIPGKVVELLDEHRAMIDYGGTRREANLQFVEANIDDWVVVHAGFALQILKEEEAMETLKLWDEVLTSFDPPDEEP